MRVSLSRDLFLKRLNYVLVLRVFGIRGDTTKNFTIDFSAGGGSGVGDGRSGGDLDNGHAAGEVNAYLSLCLSGVEGWERG